MLQEKRTFHCPDGFTCDARPEDKEIVVDRLRGTSKKGELTETMDFINGTSVTSTPTYNFLGAIQGRMPGLNIYRQGGDMPSCLWMEST